MAELIGNNTLNDISGNVNRSLSEINFDFKGYRTTLDWFDIINETISTMVAKKIPYGKVNMYIWQVNFVSSVLKFLAKKAVKTGIDMVIPGAYLKPIGDLKYIGNGIINVAIGTMAKYGLDYSGISPEAWEGWQNEMVDEIKVEVIKGGMSFGYDKIMGY